MIHAAERGRFAGSARQSKAAVAAGGAFLGKRLRRCALLAFLLLPALKTFAQGLEEIEHSTIEVDELLQNAYNSPSDADAYALADKSLAMSRDLRYDGGVVRASTLLAEVCVRTNRIEEALQHYLEAEEKLGPAGEQPSPLMLNRSALLAVYRGLGDLFSGEKLYGNARRYYAKVMSLTPDDYSILEKTADTYLFETKIDSADAIYTGLIRHFDEQDDKPKLVRVYQKLADAHNEAGNTGKGLFYYLAIENIVDHHGDPVEKALMYNNIGKQYALTNDYKNARDYFNRALILCEYILCDYLDLVYANIGIALHNTGNTPQGMEYLLKARRLLEARKDRAALAKLEQLIAGMYFKDRDVYNALTHNNEAIRYALETRQRAVLAGGYRAGADIYYQLYDFEKAYEYYQKYLNLDDSMRREEQNRQERIDRQRSLLTAREGQIKYLIARQNFKELENQQLLYDKERLSLINANQELELQNNYAKVKQLEAEGIAAAALLNEQTLQALQANQQLLLSKQRLDSLNRVRLIADLRQQEQLDRSHRQADSVRMERLRQDQAFQKREQENFKLFAYGIGGLGLVILGLLVLAWWLARRSGRRLAAQNREIEAQKAQIEIERQKSDTLLLNILPDEIAHELRTQGYANPRFYDSATVLFTDFLNFTTLSEKLSPEQLIGELDECFLAFDEICDKYGLEKIKTIGDAFMCAGGLPLPNDTHPVDAVRAALDMIAWLERRNRENTQAVFREMRIGIHTGPVIAGVIGKNKFAYDIWGDAVNLAARLEELGEPGRINISGATCEAVKQHFQCVYRGKKAVHNKGSVDMFFIERGV